MFRPDQDQTFFLNRILIQSFSKTRSGSDHSSRIRNPILYYPWINLWIRFGLLPDWTVDNKQPPWLLPDCPLALPKTSLLTPYPPKWKYFINLTRIDCKLRNFKFSYIELLKNENIFWNPEKSNQIKKRSFSFTIDRFFIF